MATLRFIIIALSVVLKLEQADMNIEQHVTSLEISKRLKELGVKQKSMFMWDYDGKLRVGIIQAISPHIKTAYPDEIEIIKVEDCYSAFLASELGELLPKRLIGDHPLWYLTIHCNDNYHNVSYETFNGRIQEDQGARDKNLADAMGKMLIYLLENKLI